MLARLQGKNFESMDTQPMEMDYRAQTNDLCMDPYMEFKIKIARVFTASVPRPHGGAEAQRKSECNQQAAPAREPPVSGTDTEAMPTASALPATETQNSVGAPATTPVNQEN